MEDSDQLFYKKKPGAIYEPFVELRLTSHANGDSLTATSFHE